jgi:hypothetical protein
MDTLVHNSGGAPNLGKGFQLILDGQEIKLQAEMARDEEDWIEKIRVGCLLEPQSLHHAYRIPIRTLKSSL